MAEQGCTWVLESFGEDDELVSQRECGQKLFLTFVEPKRGRPGKPVKTYPRCKRHAPPRAINEAYKMGMQVFTEEPE